MATLVSQGTPPTVYRPVYLKQVGIAGDIRVAIVFDVAMEGAISDGTTPARQLTVQGAKFSGNDFLIDIQSYLQTILCPRAGVRSMSFRLTGEGSLYRISYDMWCKLDTNNAALFDVDSQGLINQRTTDSTVNTYYPVVCKPFDNELNINYIDNNVSSPAQWCTDWDVIYCNEADYVNLTHYLMTGANFGYSIQRLGSTVMAAVAGVTQGRFGTLRAGFDDVIADTSITQDADTTGLRFSMINTATDAVYIEPIDVILLNDCSERIHFLNRFGCADGINMLFVDPERNIETEQYRQRQPTTESGHGVLPPMGGAITRTSGERRTYETRSALVYDEAECTVFLQLIQSPEIYLQVGTSLIPCVVASYRFQIEAAAPQLGSITLEMLPNSSQNSRI